jgi:hypothetical protein
MPYELGPVLTYFARSVKVTPWLINRAAGKLIAFLIYQHLVGPPPTGTPTAQR